jgi:hypothetical protein
MPPRKGYGRSKRVKAPARPKPKVKKVSLGKKVGKGATSAIAKRKAAMKALGF